MDISTLKSKLGDDYAALEQHITDLIGARDGGGVESAVDGKTRD